jgi:hypothetical protein
VNQLFPHPLNDVGDSESLDVPPNGEHGCQRPHALRHLAGLLAKRNRPPAVELANHAVRRDRRLNFRSCAEHAVLA